MNVLLCGLGAIGAIYADKLSKSGDIDFCVLVDQNRKNLYAQNPTFLNGCKLNLRYILSSEDFSADVIIIATKNNDLLDVLDSVKGFVNDNTIFLSLLNGITSEKIIADRYGQEKVLLSYYIGHSAERDGRNIFHDGVNTIVFGSKSNNDNVLKIKKLFERVNINYEIPNDIEHSLWFKFMVNVALNQTTALYKITVGEMLENEDAYQFFNNLINEVEKVAIAENINNSHSLRDEVCAFVNSMPYDSKTSMLQDVLANRKTEISTFAGTMVELGKKYKIDVPYNNLVLQKLINYF